MERQLINIESRNLEKDMQIAVYGHYGTTMMLFSTNEDNCLDNEENGIIPAIYSYIKNGKLRVCSVPTNEKSAWHSNNPDCSKKSAAHYAYNNFLIEEVIPTIYDNCGGAVPIITAGASLGAYHAANTYFRRPDIFLGTIAMSGFFDIKKFSGDYFDDNCYFNSPIHYLPNLTDNYWIAYLKSRKHVYLVSGTGEGESPQESTALANILLSKDIPHLVDIWGPEWGHNPETWQNMLTQFIKLKL